MHFSDGSDPWTPDVPNPVHLLEKLGTVDLHIAFFLGSLWIMFIGHIEGIPQETDVRLLESLECLLSRLEGESSLVRKKKEKGSCVPASNHFLSGPTFPAWPPPHSAPVSPPYPLR